MSPTPDVDAVLFDLDGTLCRRTQEVDAVYEAAFERVGAEPFGEPAALWEAVDGPPDPDDWVGQLGTGFARLAAQAGARVDPLALAEAFVEGVDHTRVDYLPGAERALAAARDRGPVGLLTNGPEHRQRPKVETLGLDVDPIVYAGDLPRRKPHAAPFERAVDGLGVPADRVLYVGNSLRNDVAGAHTAGLPSAWLSGGDDPGAYRPDHVLESIGDLPGLLG